MTKKKNINYEEQIKNSANFLQKLESIKHHSKDIKQKNKLTFHRNLWVKQYKYLARLQRQSELQLDHFLQNLDNYMQYEIEERQIFKKDDYKSCKQMKDQLNNNYELFQHNIFRQMENLPVIIGGFQSIERDENIGVEDVREFIREIQGVLVSTGKELGRQQENQRLATVGDQYGAEEFDQGYDDIVFYLKPIADEVKGFDFKKQRLRKIEEGQSHLVDYLLKFQDKLTGDEISEVIEEFNHASNLLNQTLELQIQKINLDYDQALNFSHSVIQNSQNYQKFLHIYQTYLGRGKNLIQYFQRLAIQFPKVSKPNLENINNYVVAKIYRERKIKAAKRNYLREKEELFFKVEKEVNMRIEKKIKDAQKEAETLMRREDKLKLEKELEGLRAEYRIREEEKEKQKRAIEEQKKIEDKKKDGLRRLYLQDLGKRADEVKQIKHDKKKEISLAEQQRRQREQNQKKKKLAQNQPKVLQRHSIQRKKLEKKVEHRQYKQKEQQIKEQRINRAIESYPFRPQVLPSEQRLNAPTEAMVIRKEVEYDMAYKVELSKKTGYSTNQLMSDVRFKLNVALQEAGLANTDYARDMLVQMSRKPQ